MCIKIMGSQIYMQTVSKSGMQKKPEAEVLLIYEKIKNQN